MSPAHRRLYCFYKDEESNKALLEEVSLGTWGPLGVFSDGRTWGFALHTAHNSLVLGEPHRLLPTRPPSRPLLQPLL